MLIPPTTYHIRTTHAREHVHTHMIAIRATSYLKHDFWARWPYFTKSGNEKSVRRNPKFVRRLSSSKYCTNTLK